MTTRKIIYNAMMTPDGTLLESLSRHDYQAHTDTITGELYMVDGGNDYCRRTVNKVPAEDLTVYSDDSEEKILEVFLRLREIFEWGTYGKNGDQPLKKVKLKDMSNAHLEAIHKDGYIVAGDLIRRELEYRKVNNIFIEDL